MKKWAKDYIKSAPNIWVRTNFINPADVTVGGTNVSEKFDKTALEVGGGFQVPVTGTTYVYTDARYDRSVKGNKEQGKLTIGFKTQY